MIGYRIGLSGQLLVFETGVLERFYQFRQTRFWHREAGGQLFARFETGVVRVIEATGPRPTDRRSRISYIPDRRAEQAEIDIRFLDGAHFIGDWHTHPEDRPNPSIADLRSTADGVRKSRHELNAFVIVIVGRTSFPEALYVAVHDGSTSHVLTTEENFA